MTVYTVTDDFYDSFAEMFDGIAKVEVLPKKNQKHLKDAELVIFTGGEDVHPTFYNSNRIYGDWYNKERDSFELSVAYDLMTGEFPAKKTLGVCRGIQLLNVAMGGILIMDLKEDYGVSHEYIHAIEWMEATIFSEFAVVNSFHHEAVRTVGSRIRGKILAIEPKSRIVESVAWGNNFFGIQWHPELLHGEAEEEKKKFAEILMEWVNGKPLQKSGGILSKKNMFLSYSYHNPK